MSSDHALGSLKSSAPMFARRIPTDPRTVSDVFLGYLVILRPGPPATFG